MPTPETFETHRLKAERLSPDNTPFLHELHADIHVMATLGGVRSESRNQAWIEEKQQHWDKHGFGLYVFFDVTGNFVGRGGLHHIEIEGKADVELYYAIAHDKWGQGYATELSQGILKIGFASLKLRSIIAFTLQTNLASQRVMQKIGMTYERDFTHYGSPHTFYRLSSP
jgi:ribosomal-protein-alanine N-acetyltransferase